MPYQCRECSRWVDEDYEWTFPADLCEDCFGRLEIGGKYHDKAFRRHASKLDLRFI